MHRRKNKKLAPEGRAPNAKKMKQKKTMEGGTKNAQKRKK